MRDQCDARPVVKYPAIWHHCPVTGTKLYCLVTEADVCEQLAENYYLATEWLTVKIMTS